MAARAAEGGGQEGSWLSLGAKETGFGGNTLRRINRRDRGSVYNILRSIYEDSLVLRDLKTLLYGKNEVENDKEDENEDQKESSLPFLANLRCGAWYSSSFDGDCYFKSTDGHTNHYDFSLTRLNAHVALACAHKGGAVIVDSTKSVVKKFPDALSKTIPIWCCVLNRALGKLKLRTSGKCETSGTGGDRESVGVGVWDSDLHLPAWIPDHEKALIEPLLDGWAEKLLSVQPSLLRRLEKELEKPLRPLWVSDRSVIWSDALPQFREYSFTPLYLLSASKTDKHPAIRCEKFNLHSWTYIHGAADDHEHWARGLTPQLFWSNHGVLLDTDPEEIEEVIEELVKAHSGSSSRAKPLNQKISSAGQKSIAWVGRLGLGLGSIDCLGNPGLLSQVDTVLDCSSVESNEEEDDAGQTRSRGLVYRRYKVESFKYNRVSLLNVLQDAILFLREELAKKRKVLVVCDDGQDTSPSLVSAFALHAFPRNKGQIDLDTTSADMGDFEEESGLRYSKEDVRNAVSNVKQYCPTAHPSRGSIKQVYHFFYRL